LKRRTFFKSSAALAVMLIAWRQGVVVPARKITNRLSEFLFLERSDIPLVYALAESLLPFKEWTTQSLTRLCTDLDHTVSLMEPSVQKEIRQLFDLLNLPVMRLWLCLPIKGAIDASKMQVVLTKMDRSFLKDLNAASLALSELIPSVYYASLESEIEIGYAPPVEIL